MIFSETRHIANVFYDMGRRLPPFFQEVCRATIERDEETLIRLMTRKQAINRGLLGPAYILALQNRDVSCLQWLCRLVGKICGEDRVRTMGCRGSADASARWPELVLLEGEEICLDLDISWEAAVLCALIGEPQHLEVLHAYPRQKCTAKNGADALHLLTTRFHMLMPFVQGYLPSVTLFLEDTKYHSSIRQEEIAMTPLGAAIHGSRYDMVSKLLQLKEADPLNDVCAGDALCTVYQNSPAEAQKLYDIISEHLEKDENGKVKRQGSPALMDLGLETILHLNSFSTNARGSDPRGEPNWALKHYRKHPMGFFEALMLLEAFSSQYHMVSPILNEDHFQLYCAVLKRIAEEQGCTGGFIVEDCLLPPEHQIDWGALEEQISYQVVTAFPPMVSDAWYESPKTAGIRHAAEQRVRTLMVYCKGLNLSHLLPRVLGNSKRREYLAGMVDPCKWYVTEAMDKWCAEYWEAPETAQFQYQGDKEQLMRMLLHVMEHASLDALRNLTSTGVLQDLTMEADTIMEECLQRNCSPVKIMFLSNFLPHEKKEYLF